MKIFHRSFTDIITNIVGALGLCSLLFLGRTAPALAQTSDDELYVTGVVVEALDIREESWGGMTDYMQDALVEVREGEKSKVVTVEYALSGQQAEHAQLKKGDRVVLIRTLYDDGSVTYGVMDHYRLPTLFWISFLFVALAVILGRKKGVMSLLGLGVSCAILVFCMVPLLEHGYSALWVTVGGSIAIALTSFFLAHGFSRRTLLAFSATMAVLFLAFLLAYASAVWGFLSGASSEDAIFLQMNVLPGLDLRELLIGAFVIGALGVLDDVTTAQIATVEEIYRAKNSLSRRELFLRGLSVGREHIASLVNTLALAYVGASFPLFLLFAAPGHPPLWMILNGEPVAEEIVRALMGGSVLMLAVPLSTWLAAWACTSGWITGDDSHYHHHHHHHG